MKKMSSLTNSSADEDSADEFDCLPALRLLHLTDDLPETIPAGRNPATSSTLPDSSSASAGSLTQSAAPPSPVDRPSPPPPPSPTSPPSPPSGADGHLQSLLLTQDRLQDGLRVLIAEDGVFHGGSVRAIRPPDIYGVVVDGERGSRPRILSTEELLKDGVT